MNDMLFICFIIAVYFIPAMVASGRDHSSTAAIFVLNFLLGWTLLGWIISLVWAFAGENRSKMKVASQKRLLGDNQQGEWLPDETRREFEERIARRSRDKML